MEQFICDRIKEMFITNEDEMQNIQRAFRQWRPPATKDWSLHITPSDKGGHYNIVNLIDSVIIPAMEKYSILVKTKLDIQNREVQITVGKAAAGVITIESDLPNIIKKSVTIKQVSADVNKLVIYDAENYSNTGFIICIPILAMTRRTVTASRLWCVRCRRFPMKRGAALRARPSAPPITSSQIYPIPTLIELTMMNGDALLRAEADGSAGTMACAGSPAQAVPAMWTVSRHSPTTGNITPQRPRQG